MNIMIALADLDFLVGMELHLIMGVAHSIFEGGCGAVKQHSG